MKILLLAIGRKHDQKLVDALYEYEKRLEHYADVSWDLVEAKITSSMNPEEIKKAESQVLLARTTTNDTLVLLDETGQQLSSPELAAKIQTFKNSSTKRLVFIIGGAYGVTGEVQQRANLVWSLSKLVFPHQLVRLILVEQLYRAHTILAREKYHHQ